MYKVPNSKKRGFTLIELMFTIAIITLLIASSFVAISQSRSNAADRNVMADFGLLRLEAEKSYRANLKKYGEVCEDTADMRDDLQGAAASRCVDGQDGYAIEVELNNGDFYCVNAFAQPTTTSASSIDSGSGCDIATGADCTCG